MPTYDYLCKKCGHRFEEFQSIIAEPIKICPQCSGTVERLINGGIGLIFKGSGFYLTDYARNKNDGKEKKTDKGTSQDSGKKAESKSTSENKPATAKAVE